MISDILNKCTGFDWDDGNASKNWEKHSVSQTECEQVFFNKPLLLLSDEKHSKAEKRYHALGVTNINKLLFITFTLRKDQIRVISARTMNKKECNYYERA